MKPNEKQPIYNCIARVMENVEVGKETRVDRIGNDAERKETMGMRNKCRKETILVRNERGNETGERERDDREKRRNT